MEPQPTSRLPQNCSRNSRRGVLTAGCCVVTALLAGCSERIDTGDSEGGGSQENNQTNESKQPKQEQKMTVEDTSFEVRSIENGTEAHNAVITRDGNTIHVEGMITGRNTCYTADLRETTSEGDDLHIWITSYENSDDDEMCGQALVDIEYTTEVVLSATPATVVVEHNGDVVARD